MYELIVNKFAEETLDQVARKNNKAYIRLSDSLDELEQNGLQASNVKPLKNAPKIFRKRTGRWRILFTIRHKIIDVWIIGIEKDTDKDYKRWINLISYQ
ncbi:MAG: hypothetical protein ABIH39_05235 [Candidatus Margulisiibacteriota bacterium]